MLVVPKETRQKSMAERNRRQVHAPKRFDREDGGWGMGGRACVRACNLLSAGDQGSGRDLTPPVLHAEYWDATTRGDKAQLRRVYRPLKRKDVTKALALHEVSGDRGAGPMQFAHAKSNPTAATRTCLPSGFPVLARGPQMVPGAHRKGAQVGAWESTDDQCLQRKRSWLHGHFSM